MRPQNILATASSLFMSSDRHAVPLLVCCGWLGVSSQFSQPSPQFNPTPSGVIGRLSYGGVYESWFYYACGVRHRKPSMTD